ncbi:ester cyclase [Pseudoduganella violacea]|uniref:Putative ester cyclase n=1 Tax=Pseudoduganella violacea TaxID=1715466 RepID=A0A7W5FSM0_9BURK|nr:ester cyclase [Pseudoduganella violacea]MBB3117697.1 putative ester cyclase [Pseudoduganella violacea]
MRAIDNVARNKAVVRKLYEECFNQANLALLNELIAPDFVGSKGELGPREFAATVTSVQTGFPGVQFRIEDLFGEGDRVAVRWTFHAAHGGPFAGVPPSNVHVTQQGNVIYQLRDGQIIRAWLQVDRLGVLQQIGVMPPSFAAPRPVAVAA